jgi:hypothetical protein
MRRRFWLMALSLYALAGFADGAYRLSALHPAAAGPASSALVAFCAALFWPLDIAARLLLSR